MCHDTVEFIEYELSVDKERLLHTHHEDILAIHGNCNVRGGDGVRLCDKRNYDSNNPMCPPSVTMTIWYSD